MKSSKLIFSAIALVATITLWAGTVQAGVLQVPHDKQDRVIVYAKKTPYANPVDYWWHLNPSATGNWDYFSPVSSIRQPLAVERGTVPTVGTPAPSVRDRVNNALSTSAVYGNQAVKRTPPANYRQVNY